MTNWTPISDFANLEELRIYVWDADQSLSHLLLQSVTSPCLRRVLLEVEIGNILWPFLDEGLVDLVRRHKACRNFALQTSTKADPEEVRSLLPRAAQEGGLEVGFSKRSDYCA